MKYHWRYGVNLHSFLNNVKIYKSNKLIYLINLLFLKIKLNKIFYRINRNLNKSKY